MKKLWKNTIIGAAGLIAALLLLFIYSQFLTSPRGQELPPYIQPQTDGVFITAISGEVYILRGAETITAQPGQALEPGDVLKVVDDSYCQVQFAQQGSATVHSNTLMRLQQFLNAQKDMDIRTEILMGSMLYKVNEDAERRGFQVESQGVIYDITGTEFLLTAQDGETRLSVTEGRVVLRHIEGLWNDLEALAGQEVRVAQSDEAPQLSNQFSAVQEETLEDLRGLSSLEIQEEQEAVLIVLETIPSGAQIYLNGRMIGHGRFQGLFTPGQELQFLVRKRGYSDQGTMVVVEAGRDQLIELTLEPLALEESLNEPTPGISQDHRLEELQSQYQQDLDNRDREIQNLSNRVNQILNQVSDLEGRLDQEAQRSASMEEQLSNKEQEISRLKSLIQQIQEIADQ